jgi:hypothetical protein
MLPVHCIEQIAVSLIKREHSERQLWLVPLIFSLCSAAHSLAHLVADTIGKYAISQGSTRMCIDCSRANRFDSVGLVLEDGYLVLYHVRRSRRVVLHLFSNNSIRASRRLAIDA